MSKIVANKTSFMLLHFSVPPASVLISLGLYQGQGELFMPEQQKADLTERGLEVLN